MNTDDLSLDQRYGEPLRRAYNQRDDVLFEMCIADVLKKIQQLIDKQIKESNP